jgi:hypothetical protein
MLLRVAATKIVEVATVFWQARPTTRSGPVKLMRPPRWRCARSPFEIPTVAMIGTEF